MTLLTIFNKKYFVIRKKGCIFALTFRKQDGKRLL